MPGTNTRAPHVVTRSAIRRNRSGPGRWLRAGFVLVILLPILWILGLGSAIFFTGQHDEAVLSDAIVVLGAAQYQGSPSPVFKARLDHAYGLYREGKAPVIVVTGGKQLGDIYTEGMAGTIYLQHRGVPRSHLLAVGYGHNTLRSLKRTAREMKSRGMKSAIIVSDRFHIFRSEKMAESFGLVVHGSPTTTSPIERDKQQYALNLFREVAAYTAFLFGLES